MGLPETWTLYHNPKCTTSRNVLALMEKSGRRFQTVEYLKVGWTLATLKGLLTQMKAEPRAILRTREALVESLGLDRPGVSGEEILQAMIAHPVLVERPILVGPKGAAVCRPVEKAETLI